MKKTAKRALSFLLTLVMLVSTMSVGFFGITSLAATNATVNSAHQAVIAVPETVYMTPKNGASTTGQYYVNNTISGGNTFTVVPEASANNTKGYVQLYIPGAKSVTYSVNYCSGTNVGAVTVTNEETAKTFTDDYVKLNETTISVGTGLNPGETSLVEWKFTVTMNDDSERVYYAYSTLYAPYISSVGALAYNAGRYDKNYGEVFASNIAWITGVHDALIADRTNTGSSNTYYRLNGTSYETATSSSYYQGLRYPKLSGTNIMDTLVSDLTINNGKTNPEEWFSTSSTGVDNTFRLIKVQKGDDHNDVQEVSPIAKLTVDTSRYTNFSQIPNLTIGYQVTDVEKADETYWYFADYTDVISSVYSKQIKSDRQSSEQKIYDDGIANGNSVKVFASSGAPGVWSNSWGAEGDYKKTLYNGTWTRDIKNADSNSKNYYLLKGSVHAYNKATLGTGRAYTHLFVQVEATNVNKATLRQLVLQGASFNEKNYTETTWKVYKEALANAALALGNPVNSTIDTATLTTARDALQTNVKFDTLGGTNAPATGAATIGANTTATYNTPAYNGTLEGHTFKGWSTDKDAKTGSTTVTVGFNNTLYAIWEINKYTVTWDVDGTKITQTYNYGSTPSYPNGTPTKTDPDNLYKYTFTGWDKAISAVTGDVTYVAQFSEEKLGHTITWKVDGQADVTTVVAPGATPEYPNGTPTKAATAEYTYTFSGWSPAVNAATGDATYTAQFKAEKRSYTITWLDDEGNLIDTTTVKYGDTPTHSAPTKESTPEFSYEFTGWSPALEKVTGDKTYTATFKSNTREYWVSWVDHNGSVIKEAEKVAYGTTPTAPADPVRNSSAQYDYTFAGWTPKVDAITGDTTYKATYTESLRSYTITWVIDGVSDTTTVKYGDVPTHADPTKAETDAYTYEFTGWDTTPVAVTGEATYTAQFKATKKSYTITWVIDGVSETTSVEYGEMPTHADPTKASTPEFSYTFTGWSPAIKAVDGEATYTAQFKEAKRSYTITFVNHNDEVLYSADFEYGATPAYDGETPVKAGDAQFSYAFTGWDPEIAKVTGDATYTAQFEESTNVYTVTWKNYDGTLLETDENVPYGTTPEYNGATPKKPSTDQYEYVFENKWTPAVDKVTGDVTYTAQFTAKVIKYTVSWVDGNGNLLYADEVEYGTVPVYDDVRGGTPTKNATAQYTYTFNNEWSPKVVAVTGKATYTAQFTSTVNKYTITWKNGDDVLKTEKVAYDELPVYDGTTPSKAADAQYTYTFSGWTPAIVPVTGDATYTATYTGAIRSYTIKFFDEDGKTLLQERTLDYGAKIEYTGETPTKTETAQYKYTFAGWEGLADGATVTGEATYKATYKSDKRSYTITWLNDDGSPIDTTTVEYGVKPTHADATKAKTAEYTYTFADWINVADNSKLTDATTVKGDATYKATFKENPNSYTITWKNYDGSVITTTTVEYGATIEKPAVPEREGYIGEWVGCPVTMPATDIVVTAKYTNDGIKVNWVIKVFENGTVKDLTETTVVKRGETIKGNTELEKDFESVSTVYKFKGWAETQAENAPLVNTWPTVDASTTEQTYYAVYETSARKYTIKFVDEDGTELQSGKVAYGEKPVYTGAEPTKATTAQYTYTFAGWGEIKPVTGDATYTAIYTSTVNKYTIKFVNEDGTELQSSEVAYGEKPAYTGDTPTKAPTADKTFTFSGWTPLIQEVTGDATYTATYSFAIRTYTVTWKNYDGTTLETDENVAYGATPDYNGSVPTKQGDAQYSYTFDKWNPVLSAVASDVIYTATFTRSVNKYTITFVDEDGTKLQSSEVAYGATPVYDGTTPSKAADAQYTYSFDKWSPELVAVTGDATYKATYTSAVNEYTIKFVDEDGKVLQSGKVAYGETPVYTGAEPTKAADDQYTYTFAGWGEIKSVTGDATYKATYSSTVNKYTITWIVNGKSTTEQVEYGTIPSFKGSTDKAPTNTTVYTFAGWDNTPVKVTGPATYTATYNEAVRKYTITWVVNGTSTTEQYKYNELPSFKGSTDIPETPAATYVFKGWSPAIKAVTGDATYTAEYDVTVRGFVITWIVDGVKTTEVVEYGKVPVFAGSTDKAPTATETFTFAGWDKTPVAATEDTTYTATYTSAARKYTVEWVVDGVVVKTEKLAYNSVIPVPGLPADKEGYTVKWDNTISIMPASDITIEAIYTPRMYPVYWIVDGTTVYSASVPFGTAIPEKAVPAKEGHTGKWLNVPATMPAGIVMIEAQYTARTYQVFWKIGDAQNTESATYGIDYVVTFSGVNAPEDLRITVGGVVLTADKYEYNSETGTLKIAGNAITGNINIIAKSTSGSVSVVNSIFGGASLNSNSVIDIRTTYHATITPDAGYVLPKTIAIYVDGILITEGYVYDSTTGKLTINAEVIVGDIEIYAECEEDPTYDATGECTCSCHSKNSLVAFFFKIFTFLRKLFGMSQYQYCGCGAAHW